jgi:hypothetical protein
MITDVREECAVVTDRRSASRCSARRSAVTIASRILTFDCRVKVCLSLELLGIRIDLITFFCAV